MPFVAHLPRAGYRPLQDHRPVKLRQRSVSWALRLTAEDFPSGRWDSRDPDKRPTEGDILCATIWRNEPSDKERKWPGWAYAWPAVTQEDVAQGEGTRERGAKKVGILPVYDQQLSSDSRFEEVQAAIPDTIEELPEGTLGIMIGGTKETSQENIFLPTSAGSNLISVNYGIKPAKGTFIYDTDDKGRVDKTRRARLQSFTRVVKLQENTSVAWQLGQSGRDDLRGGGLVYDLPSSALDTPTVDIAPASQPETDPNRTRERPKTTTAGGTSTHHGEGTTTRPNPANPGLGVVGYAAARLGGPFDVGGKGDQHSWGATIDGEQIHPVHLQTNSLFRGRGGDAPLPFENKVYTKPDSQPLNVPVHLRIDPSTGHTWAGGGGQGLWRLEAEAPVAIPPEGEPEIEYWIPGGEPFIFVPERPETGTPPPPPPVQPPPTGNCNKQNPVGWTPPGGGPTRTFANGGERVEGTRERNPSGCPGPATSPLTDSEVAVLIQSATTGRETGAITAGGISAAPTAPVRPRSAARDGDGPKEDKPPKKSHKGMQPGETRQPAIAPTPICSTGFIGCAFLTGDQDIRYKKGLTPAEIAQGSGPATFRITPFAPTVGGDFQYTQKPGNSISPTGTASGGLLIGPPEVDLEDSAESFEPSGRATSSGCFVFLPGFCINFGVPDLETGELDTGFSIERDSSGQLNINKIDGGSVTSTKTYDDIGSGSGGGVDSIVTVDLGSEGSANWEIVCDNDGNIVTNT